jgi:type IV pilus assembly protein PilP
MMQLRYLIIISASVLVLVVACSEEPIQPPQPIVPQVAATQKVDPAVEVKLEEAPPKYIYEVTGRRDPFAPLLVVSQQPVPIASTEPQTPLESYDIAQLRLVAIIIGKGPSSAMVMAPDGKGYILKKGIRVGKNRGLVIGIRSDTVLVEEQFIDFSGEIKKSTQEIQLPKREGV